MTDEQLEELMQLVKAGDSEAQAQIDAWIEEALGPMCTTAPIGCETGASALGELSDTICCGSCSGAFAG